MTATDGESRENWTAENLINKFEKKKNLSINGLYLLNATAHFPETLTKCYII